MEMESTWKPLFQRRLVLATKHCNNVHGLLRGLLEVVDADVQNRSRHHQGPCAEAAQRALEAASMELGLALASMGAARHLALRGGAPCPSAPLDSVDDLAGDPGVWWALESLEKAAGLATGVHDAMECARGHLRAAAFLAVLDGVGGEEGGACFSEQISGAMELGEAVLKAEDLVAETATAREAAFGFIDDAK
ncbi:hypothetical protein BAE44_0002989 [Dichanthelium oligosanthes]|uniref:Uncharacterized protein n=1 Tax=Dichanthelium oligosanthes TaxID=888268 RepID=A0A1E5WEZ7_9POAL|nr:hypothetical protein BAE44_0002989 [Dichanthelium oligosanthes]